MKDREAVGAGALRGPARCGDASPPRVGFGKLSLEGASEVSANVAAEHLTVGRVGFVRDCCRDQGQVRECRDHRRDGLLRLVAATGSYRRMDFSKPLARFRNAPPRDRRRLRGPFAYGRRTAVEIPAMPFPDLCPAWCCMVLHGQGCRMAFEIDICRRAERGGSHA